MDFAFDQDQQLLKNSARAFLDEHCKPALVRALWDDRRGESEAMWKEMAQLGWLGLSLPEAHGGSGLGMVETAIVVEELGRAAYPGPMSPRSWAASAIAEAGSAAQPGRWLPAIAIGERAGGHRLAGHRLDWDPKATATTATPTASGWTSRAPSASCPGRTWPTFCSCPRAAPRA